MIKGTVRATGKVKRLKGPIKFIMEGDRTVLVREEEGKLFIESDAATFLKFIFKPFCNSIEVSFVDVRSVLNEERKRK